jgi:acyl-CoA thioesterase
VTASAETTLAETSTAETSAAETPAAETSAAELWRLRRAFPGRFVGWGQNGVQNRAFGGQVSAQAVAAAQADLGSGWRLESLHA